jgi:D-alanyl-lipoteichoic acid acyltransferase DltB (MBOAT superfamily)
LFYGWWDWRFLSLLFFSTFVDYLVGIGLSNSKNQFRRKALLCISIIVNLGFLIFFKYYNFFLENFLTAFSFFGTKLNASSLKVILPVGISFYTFQTLSYSIDVYKRKLTPTKDFVAFSAFVSFFPQLVAGPIERATNLLPQFYKKRNFYYFKAVDGMRQILWGLFKKMVIADNCAEYANLIFNNAANYSSGVLVLGAIFFTFQIYADFSAYSEIAIGTSKLFGFDLKQNFNYPYFSRDIAEFWRRWHISLSTWFRDYLYIPIGGSRGDLINKIRNIFIIFIVSVFWHGANWTFIIWGILHAIYFLPLLLTKKNRKNVNTIAEGKNIPSLKEFFQIATTFSLTVFAWIFFRAENLGSAIFYIERIFSFSNSGIDILIMNFKLLTTIVFLAIFIVIEWLNREKQFALQINETGLLRFSVVRKIVYLILIFSIAAFAGGQQQFIYFQF